MQKNKLLTDNVVDSDDKITLQNNLFNKGFKSPVLFGILTFFILVFLFTLLVFQRIELIKQSESDASETILKQTENRILETLVNGLAAAKTLAFFIDKNGVVNEFDSVAKLILESNKYIDALQLVPGGVIRNMYPYSGNENVIGYDILNDSSRNKEAYKAIEKKEIFFAGPFELRQGGVGIVGRLPVYRNNEFWGFSAVVIKLSTLMKNAGIGNNNEYYSFQLSKINPDTHHEELFLPASKNNSIGKSVSIKMPDGDWKLTVISKNDYTGYGNVFLLGFLGLLFSVVGGITAYRISVKPYQLNELVKERTLNLKSSEVKYRSLIERVSDAFVALDKDWKYNYVNRKAGEIFGRAPETLIGKNIWEEFPEGIDKPFYHAYFRAEKTQEYQYLEEYYAPYDKWFENHIYPSENGLTIFFKDVTEIKKIQKKIIESEFKYRSLIEQASDGIVLTDLSGQILEVNDSMLKMLDLLQDEMIGMNISDFIPVVDKTLIPLRIDDLKSGKSLLYERRLVKKDRSIINVEVNSRMAGNNLLIGFIRDITDRKQAENELKISNDRFSLISEATKDVIWDHDFVENKTWGNNKLYELYGLKPEESEVTFDTFLDNIHPEDKGMVMNLLTEALQRKQEIVSVQFRFKTADGDYRDFYDRAYVKYDASGNPSRIVGAMDDITEREIIKEQIVKEKELSDTIINSLPGIFYLFNKEGNFIRWNNNFETVTGYSASEISVMSPLDFFDALDKKMISETIEQVYSAGVANVEANLLLKNGSKLAFYFTGQYIIYEGQECVLGVGLDISEKEKATEAIRNSEIRYQTIIEQASDGIFIADSTTMIIDVNTAACKMLGYTKEELLKIKFTSLVPLEDLEINPISIVHKEAGHTIINERRLIKKDKSLLEVEISAKVLNDGRYQSIVRDITERRKADAEIRTNAELLREMYSYLQNVREEERTYMAREIHDELGQQLTGLKMDISWLNRRLISEDQLIHEKLTGALQLIDNTIRTVRRIATELRPSILDDLGLLAALEWQGEEFARRSELKVSFESNLPEIVIPTDISTNFFRIYQELLTNVARHSEAKNVTTSFYFDNNALFLSVKDDGTGFDLSDKLKSKTLGLRGINERSKLIGGTCDIQSILGKGTFVLISVPLHIKETIKKEL